MIKSIFLLAAIPTASFGFHPVVAPPKNASHRSPVTVLEAKKKRKASGKDNLSLRQDGPLQMEVPVDIDRARDCAENFGKCSRAEMKDLRDGLHRERVQNSVFGIDNLISPTSPDESLDHLVIEEELNLQLDLLNEQIVNEKNEASLFPVEEMVELPHLKDSKTSEAVHKAQQSTALNGGLLEEANLESLAFCLLIGVALVAPQVFN